MHIVPIQDASEWHAIRSKHIGGSEIGALFGVSPYKTHFELWHEKRGDINTDGLSSERVEAGNFMEPAIAAWAAHKYGVAFSKFQGYCLHPSIKGMGCTPDYISDDGLISMQIKNVDSIEFSRNKNWNAEGDILTDAPMHILLQCQHELACTGIQTCWLVVCIGGNRLVRMVINANAGVIKRIEGAVEAFWESIDSNVPPSPVYEEDGGIISAIVSMNGAKPPIDLSNDNEAAERLRQYMEGREMESAGAALKSAAQAYFIERMNGAVSAKIGECVARCTFVAANDGKPITQDMVGTITGKRAASIRFTVKLPKE